MTIEISAVITVYNKASFLPATIASLLNQTIGHNIEYIFVDDASTDNSVDVIKRCTKGHKNIQIIKNTNNVGPSIRLNQGAGKAQGKYLLLMDGDDVLFSNVAEMMQNLLKTQHADFIYGKRKRLTSQQNIPFAEMKDFVVTDNALFYILHNRNLMNMAALVKTSLFKQAGGADERIFIQDESLLIRLAFYAKRFIDLKSAVFGVVPELHGDTTCYKRLSKNNSQQYHDRFFAYYNFMQDHAGVIGDIDHLVYARCIASAWRYAKEKYKLPYLSKIICYYLLTKIVPKFVSISALEELRREFLQVDGVRR